MADPKFVAAVSAHAGLVAMPLANLDARPDDNAFDAIATAARWVPRVGRHPGSVHRGGVRPHAQPRVRQPMSTPIQPPVLH
ncbi:MAG: hypothetical protein P4L82_06790 [Ancalomicrobiaceae bacterium]|nr:hypothetical protein [Ancalomicrobiaceae bacterium]